MNNVPFIGSVAWQGSIKVIRNSMFLKIISVHKSSFYALSDAGDVLLFQSKDVGIAPFSVVIEDYERMFDYLNLRSNTSITISHRGMTETDGSPVLCLALETMPYISPAPAPVNKSNLQTGIAYIQEFLTLREQCEGRMRRVFLLNALCGIDEKKPVPKDRFCDALEIGFSRLFDALIEDFTDNTGNSVFTNNTCDSGFTGKKGGEINRIVSGLVGIGPGMTPSSDDILCGLIYCLQSVIGQCVYSNTVFALRQSILKSAGRTTIVSSAYLRAAAMRLPFRLLDSVLLGIRMQGAQLTSSMEKLILVGSNSGGEMLLGLALGAQLICMCNYTRRNENEHFSL